MCDPVTGVGVGVGHARSRSDMKSMTKLLRKYCKHVMNRLGYDISNMRHTSRYTLAGLRSLNVGSVIDVGANVGQFAKMITEIFLNAKLYCFEPLPHAFQQLKDWALTRDGRVQVFNLALGNSKGRVTMFQHDVHSPSSSLLETTTTARHFFPVTQQQSPVVVNLDTLDGVMEALPPLSPEVLIKLDVQGYEDRVIKGGMQTFKTARACIIELNVVPLYDKQATLLDVFHLMYELGFRYAGNIDQAATGDGCVLYVDSVFIRD